MVSIKLISDVNMTIMNYCSVYRSIAETVTGSRELIHERKVTNIRLSST